MLEKPTFSIRSTRHTFIPPPTEPEQAPIKATTNIKKPTALPMAVKGSKVKPVVVTIEIVWNTPYLNASSMVKPSFK